jgi:CRP/FNR family transcriptional regulator, cyclic AMP receptor protein
MASKKAYLDHLRNVPLFSSCSTKELERIAKAADEISVPEGHLLCDQGQTGREAFIILSGSALVKRNGKKITIVGPGAMVGELSLLDHGPRTATVTTNSASTLLVIDQRHFAAVLADVPTLSRKLLAALAGRIRDLDRTMFG